MQLVDQAYDAKGQLNKDEQFLRSFLLNEVGCITSVGLVWAYRGSMSLHVQ